MSGAETPRGISLAGGQGGTAGVVRILIRGHPVASTLGDRESLSGAASGVHDCNGESVCGILMGILEGTESAEMDRIVRIVVILALIAFSLFRITRYFRHGLAKRVIALPASAGMVLAATPSEPHAASSGVPQSRFARFMAGLVTLVVWLGGNALLAAALFEIPALSSVPAIWRLFVLVFANFYLVPFAKSAGAKRAQRGGVTSSGNPVGS